MLFLANFHLLCEFWVSEFIEKFANTSVLDFVILKMGRNKNV